MSQLVDCDSPNLETLSFCARHLAPLLREKASEEDSVDLSSVEISHYRLSKIKLHHLMIVKEGADTGLNPNLDLDSRKPRSKQEEQLSQIISRLKSLFVTHGPTDEIPINHEKITNHEIAIYTIYEERRINRESATGSFTALAMIVPFDIWVLQSRHKSPEQQSAGVAHPGNDCNAIRYLRY